MVPKNPVLCPQLEQFCQLSPLTLAWNAVNVPCAVGSAGTQSFCLSVPRASTSISLNEQ